MKKHIVRLVSILTALSFLSACGQTIYEDPEHVDFSTENWTPQAAVDQEETGSQANTSNPYVEQGDIRLYYDPKIETSVDDAGEMVPASDSGEMYAPAHPAFSDFNFSPIQAHIYVTSAKEYKEGTDFAASTIDDLYLFIEELEGSDNCVPELPLDTFYHDCDHQQFVSNLSAISTANGFGVRYVTVYSVQDLAPVGNDTLVYVFQGFTDDGEYYIKAIVELMR